MIKKEIKKSKFHLELEDINELNDLLDQFKLCSEGKELFVMTREREEKKYGDNGIIEDIDKMNNNNIVVFAFP